MRLYSLLLFFIPLFSIGQYNTERKIETDTFPNGVLKTYKLTVIKTSKKFTPDDYYYKRTIIQIYYDSTGQKTYWSKVIEKNSNYGRLCKEILNESKTFSQGTKIHHYKFVCDCRKQYEWLYNLDGRLVYKNKRKVKTLHTGSILKETKKGKKD